MRTFSINTLGCKVNQYESQQIRELLENLGLAAANSADLHIINTCCVTKTASAKSRQYIRKARKQNPNAAIVAAGCLPSVDIGELNLSDENTYIVRDKITLAPTLHHLICKNNASKPALKANQPGRYPIKPQNLHKIKPKTELSPLKLSNITSFKGQTRAFLKVQDGCDAFCTYCIVPKTRPNLTSKPIPQIIEEAKALIAAGHKEIVLTGIFLGAFGRNSAKRHRWPNDSQNPLVALLEKIAQLPDLPRIRLSSLESADVTERLLDVFCTHKNIMPHLHLSLQSGSNAVLKKMHRQYTAEQFLEKVELLNSRLDRPAITCDIIVGFPGETDNDFRATVDLAKKVGFAKMHVFPFSPRKGTAAAKMVSRIDKSVIKTRSEILRKLDKQLAKNFREQFIGEMENVLLEGGENGDGKIFGRAERYFKVCLENIDNGFTQNDLVQVKLTKNTIDTCFGSFNTV